MTPEQRFAFERPSFMPEDTLTNGKYWAYRFRNGIWSATVSLNVGLE